MTDVFAQFDAALAKDQIFVAEKLMGECKKVKGAKGKAGCAAREKVFVKLDKDLVRLKALLEKIESNDGWKLAKSIKGKEPMTIHFQQPEGQPFIMTKATKTIRPEEGKPLADVFVELCSLFAETDLMPKYFPMGLCESHNTLKELSVFSRYTQIRIKMPPFVPISNREAIILGKGYDMTERSAMAISFNNLTEGRAENPEAEDYMTENLAEEVDSAKPNKKYTRMEISGAYYIQLQKDGTVSFSQLMMMDLKLGKMVPPFILNQVSKGKLPLDFTNNLLKTLRKYKGSEWEKRVAAQPELYEEIRKRLNDYMANNGLDQFGVPLGSSPKKESLAKRMSARISKRFSKRASVAKDEGDDEEEEQNGLIQMIQSALAALMGEKEASNLIKRFTSKGQESDAELNPADELVVAASA